MIMFECVGCPFCERLATGELLAGNDHAAAFFDKYPISAGHCLIVPRRHQGNLLALSDAEQSAVWSLVATVQQAIQASHSPDGYNIGVNIGEAAGQTVPHAHVHMIPRYLGDVADPRGGVRWVIPARAAYWEDR